MLNAIPPEVARLKSTLPRFPDGRLDYSDAPEAAVVDCYVTHSYRLLILKRAQPLAGSLTAWHVVSGYLDEECTLQEKVFEEVFEEIGVSWITSMKDTDPYVHLDAKTWTV